MPIDNGPRGCDNEFTKLFGEMFAEIQTRGYLI